MDFFIGAVAVVDHQRAALRIGKTGSGDGEFAVAVPIKEDFVIDAKSKLSFSSELSTDV